VKALSFAHPGDIFETTPENKPENKIHPRTGHERPGQQKCSFTISLTSALLEGCGQCNAQVALPSTH